MGIQLRGQLGNGISGWGTDSNVPVRVSNLTNVVAIAGGFEHSLAVVNDEIPLATLEPGSVSFGNQAVGAYQ